MLIADLIGFKVVTIIEIHALLALKPINIPWNMVLQVQAPHYLTAESCACLLENQPNFFNGLTLKQVLLESKFWKGGFISHIHPPILG